jgi:hypothetical protein
MGISCPATYWIQRCWFASKARDAATVTITPLVHSTVSSHAVVAPQIANGASSSGKLWVDVQYGDAEAPNRSAGRVKLADDTQCERLLSLSCVVDHQTAGAMAALSPRKQRQQQREALVSRMVYIIASPFPYMVILLLISMIVMIFVNVMPISGLVCVTAVLMVAALVLGNIWLGQEVWAEADPRTHRPLHSHTFKERIESVNEFFDSLFESIDYALLMIFLGVVEYCFVWV